MKSIPFYTPKQIEAENFYWLPLDITKPRVIFRNDLFGNFFEVLPGDKVSFWLGKEEKNSAYDISLCVKRAGESEIKSINIMPVVPPTCFCGNPSDTGYTCAVTQMRNVENVIFSRHETVCEYKERRVRVLAEMLPLCGFWLIKGKNSGCGFSSEFVGYSEGLYSRDHFEPKTAEEMALQMLLNAHCFHMRKPNFSNFSAVFSHQYAMIDTICKEQYNGVEYRQKNAV